MNDGSPVIIPALMPDSLSALTADLERVLPFARTVQLDVMDGAFAPHAGWPYAQGGLQELERMARDGETLPRADTIRYEAHLMAADPVPLGELLARTGVVRIIAHAETLAASEWPRARARWQEAGASEAGIAFLLDTSFDQYGTPDGAAVIQIMGISGIGAQGQPFDARAIDRVREARDRFPGVAIAVDGGVHEETIAALVRAGASRFVAGSAISDASDPAAAYANLMRLAVDNAIAGA